MPTNKDFKRVVRDRMKKTGESYTAARSQLLHNKPTSKRRAQTARTLSAPPPADYAKLAGMSDASVKKATGCTWERWVKALDYAKADSWTHKEIAEYVHTRFKVPDWWTQTVTVGYERIKGLRARGQRRRDPPAFARAHRSPRAPAAHGVARRRNRWRRARG